MIKTLQLIKLLKLLRKNMETNIVGLLYTKGRFPNIRQVISFDVTTYRVHAL